MKIVYHSAPVSESGRWAGRIPGIVAVSFMLFNSITKIITHVISGISR